MSERGEYRAFLRVLWDGPDFRQFPERVRWVFVTLKAHLGPSGIEIAYREPLIAELAIKTGAPAKAVSLALERLKDEGWIHMQDNVVWVIKQLRFDPHMKVTNENHRKSIQAHIRGLPRLQIVQEFIEFYRPWFVDSPDLLNGIGDTIPDTIDITRPKTDDITEDITENKSETDARTGARAPEVTSALDVEQSASLVIMAANRGMMENPKIGERMNPIPTSHGSRHNVIEWLAAGIDPELLQSAVYEKALSYKPDARHRQINTMKYFDDVVNDAADLAKAGSTSIKKNGRARRQPQQHDYSNATTTEVELRT